MKSCTTTYDSFWGQKGVPFLVQVGSNIRSRFQVPVTTYTEGRQSPNAWKFLEHPNPKPYQDPPKGPMQVVFVSSEHVGSFLGTWGF